MTRTRSAIAATGLRKSFGDHVVLDGVDPEETADELKQALFSRLDAESIAVAA